MDTIIMVNRDGYRNDHRNAIANRRNGEMRLRDKEQSAVRDLNADSISNSDATKTAP